jgi:hypothetical protein
VLHVTESIDLETENCVYQVTSNHTTSSQHTPHSHRLSLLTFVTHMPTIWTVSDAVYRQYIRASIVLCSVALLLCQLTSLSGFFYRKWNILFQLNIIKQGQIWRLFQQQIILYSSQKCSLYYTESPPSTISGFKRFKYNQRRNYSLKGDRHDHRIYPSTK